MREIAKVLLGVTGSIAAYKAAHLTRLLVKEGMEVKVVMTPAASDFITPLTLATLSKNPVRMSYFDERDGVWNSHVELGLWADAMLIAPASANTMAAMACGRCDNLLLATYLSARCPVFFAPAMDLDMYAHPATQQNVELLRSRGNILIEPGSGELASGLEGRGRMAEPEDILTFLRKHSRGGKAPLAGLKAMVTAGPTYEAIDPVRFIGNRSTGKMGYALARELAEQGALVTLISGPVHQSINHPSVEVVSLESAAEMAQASIEAFTDCDIAVLAAAVADYRPAQVSEQKIKKGEGDMSICLERTTDIAAELAKLKRPDQFITGFALETHDEQRNARDKMKRKSFDMIVLNSLQDPGAGFAHDTNKVTLMFPDGSQVTGETKSKCAVAGDIVAAIIAGIQDRSPGNQR